MKTPTIGIADTTFAVVDMARHVMPILAQQGVKIARYTVPGFKDLPVACLKLFKEDKCDIVIALGMAGPMPIDKQCAHEASLGLQQVQLMVQKHIIEVFVHMDEVKSDKELKSIAINRAEKHTLNALALLKSKTALTPNAGSGRRQGKEDVGGIR
ncbi:MAG TPA: riboflavin synthase [Candidatus Nanoarchaeia archaeon]|nr:riboflavin synthase [Candidatus Nanoarchaeia archaeon]